jgi:hypothetical protein
MKTWRRGGIAPQILNFDTRCRFVVVVMSCLFYPQYVLDRGFDGPRCWPGCDGKS